MTGVVVSAQQAGGVGQIGDLLALAIGLLVIIIILAYSIRVVREYERVVVFRLGRIIGA